MKVLITGGSGFIGSHLADSLLATGHHVTVIDNFATGRRDNLRGQPGLRIVEGTIADEKVVNDVFEQAQPDIVVHAAAAYKDPADWREDIRTNVLGTANVVKAAEHEKVRRFVYFQTALCYGLHPIEQPITLNHPLRPEGSSYAISKTAGEQYVRQSALEFLSFRLANAYGPRNVSGPLPTFYKRLSEGKPCFVMATRRDFVFVSDLVQLVLMAIGGKGAPGIYHVSSGKDYSIKELFQATCETLGMSRDTPAEERERGVDDAHSILLDPSKTESSFGWAVSTRLTDGVRRTIEYYRKFGVQQTFTHLAAAVD
jgi:UDP-glucose 4-epimerase